MGRIVVGVTAVFVALALIVVGGWQAGWWFAQSGADHAAHVNRSSYGNQQTYRDQITKNLGTVSDITVQIAENPTMADQLKAQRLAVVNIVCQEADSVTGDPLPADQTSFVQANCLYGQANPSSVYAQK